MEHSMRQLLSYKDTVISNLVLDSYKKIGMTDEELVLFLQLLKYHQKGIDFPDLGEVSQCMGYSVEQLFRLIQSMVDKKYLAIQTTTNANGQSEDHYDLLLIYDKLLLSLDQEQEETKEQEQEQQVAKLFQMFEKEFGRPLSPMELETINLWLAEDKYRVEMIELALREAVLNQAYSLKYIDRILLSWERKNITSKQQIQQEQKKRLAVVDNQTIHSDKEEKLPHIPMYNWLNPKESR